MYVAQQQAHHTEHLDEINVDYMESKLMFVYTTHIYKQLRTNSRGGLWLRYNILDKVYSTQYTTSEHCN